MGVSTGKQRGEHSKVGWNALCEAARNTHPSTEVAVPWSKQKPQEHCTECWLGYKQGSPEASGCLEHRDEIILPDPQNKGQTSVHLFWVEEMWNPKHSPSLLSPSCC